MKVPRLRKKRLRKKYRLYPREYSKLRKLLDIPLIGFPLYVSSLATVEASKIRDMIRKNRSINGELIVSNGFVQSKKLG